MDEDGFVFITGRLKRIYIVTGEDNIAYKLFPQRMEESIQQIEGVEKCGVVVVPDDVRQNVAIVFITVNEEFSEKENLVKDSILNVIENKLPSYYRPKDIVILKDMPITSSQKIDYRKLEEIANSNL